MTAKQWLYGKWDIIRSYYSAGATARRRWNEKRLRRRFKEMNEEESDEYYEAFGKRVLNLMKDVDGKVPFSLRKMSERREGLVLIGRMTDKKFREANDPNYEMLRYQAQQELEGRSDSESDSRI